MSDSGGALSYGRNNVSPFDGSYTDTRLVDEARRIVSGRRKRAEFLPGEVLGEPAWDMLLDLYVALHESKRISISSACIASGVPATTALRCLGRMEELGLVRRVNDQNDGRRVYVTITDHACRAISSWLMYRERP